MIQIPQRVTTVLFAALLASCGKTAREPVTLTYPHGWYSEPDEVKKTAALSQQFTAETGIHIQDIPTPENTLDGLGLLIKLLRMGSSGADLVHVDLIWSAVLEPDLIDLKPDLGAEISSVEPQLLPTYTVNGKVVAIPYQVNIGVLEYRSDLLHEYGYNHPPATWSELERMSQRIQAGERAKGKKEFWGYVWQGAQAEGLTCNALEWQAAEGGGRIIERDRTISVNNPAAIRAWQRAKSWVGRISPPSVLAYREGDSANMFDGEKLHSIVSGWAGRLRGARSRTRPIGVRPIRWCRLVSQLSLAGPEGPELRWEDMAWRFQDTPFIVKKRSNTSASSLARKWSPSRMERPSLTSPADYPHPPQPTSLKNRNTGAGWWIGLRLRLALSISR